MLLYQLVSQQSLPMQISRSCLVIHHTPVVVSVQARGAGQKALRNTYKFTNPSKFKLDQRMHTRPPRRWRPPIVGHFLTHKYTTVPLSFGGQLFSAACMHDASVFCSCMLDLHVSEINQTKFGTKTSQNQSLAQNGSQHSALLCILKSSTNQKCRDLLPGVLTEHHLQVLIISNKSITYHTSILERL